MQLGGMVVYWIVLLPHNKKFEIPPGQGGGPDTFFVLLYNQNYYHKNTMTYHDE